MQFIPNGPDIPETLLQAHEEGRVVFFCGAGISYKVGLKDFQWLVDEIYQRCGTKKEPIENVAYSQKRYDIVLKILEDRFPGQRSSLKMRKALAEALRPDFGRIGAESTHKALLHLSQDRKGVMRLVTTNFDRSFELVRCSLKLKCKIYAAPMLPIPKNSRWDGLVYLHGLVPDIGECEQGLDNLVVTSGDFGLAYLTERWAARFVSELFRNYVVCFVGYSINDPVLRYMMDALAADRVAVKVISGDNELVTQHICAQLGLPVTGVLTGAEIQQIGDQALSARVEQVNLFCRVTPAQKNRVILALKRRGHVVGYLGDGINDAPSLHSADVSISVDSAVDVAKAAADMILLERDLGVLHAGVIEGRRTFGNIMKYIMMGTSSNFGNMFSMAGASLFLPFLPMLPVQILLNNLLYDVSELPIPLDRVDDDYLSRPRHWDMNFIRNFMLIIGPVSSVFDFLLFYIMLTVFHAGEALFHTGWFIESMATQVLVIFIIRTRKNPFKSRPNPWLIACSLTVVAVAVLLPFTPAGVYLGFVAPPALFFFILILMLIAYLLAVEGMKQWFFKHFAAE